MKHYKIIFSVEILNQIQYITLTNIGIACKNPNIRDNSPRQHEGFEKDFN